MTNAKALEAFRKTLPSYRQEEYYQFLLYRWDVVAGYFLAQKRGAAPQLIQVEHFAKNYGIAYDPQHPRNSRTGLFSVQHDWAMSGEGLSRLDDPLLIGSVVVKSGEEPSLLLLDGLHRLYRASRERREVLSAYFLTVEETTAIRV